MRIIDVDPRSARLMANDPATGEPCELDILPANGFLAGYQVGR
jgi:hypothetical protein